MLLIPTTVACLSSTACDNHATSSLVRLRVVVTGDAAGTGYDGCPTEGTPMLASQRGLFDMPRDVCYLNSASYSPLPLRTQQAACAAVDRKAKPWTLDPSFAGGQY